MNEDPIPAPALPFLTSAILVAVYVAGGLPAVIAYAIAVELWIRFLTPEPEQIPLRHDEDREG